ncbi:unnamed protein product [Trichogramma brassicae]|uniref:Reverse transcriptase domain-containing protein n=1 Tax=Trichogramma brassicae TaxID=86971 RepID=A0A6H5IHU5_9HYME|nr:unnamed protein product [Trichogramma brassicae]
MFQDYEDRRLPVRQNQNENPANPNPPREDPPAADGQGGGRGDDQRIPRADGAEPRQDNPLEQLIGNPLFQAMARAPAVNAVGNCRLPAFWRSDPDLWFLQVEAQFNIHQVTSDSTRFNMILTVLDPETISEVSDIIRAPPAQDSYTTLKDAIVARLTDSRPIPSSTSYSAPSSLETRSHRSFYCRCVRSPAHERQTTSYAYAGLTCCPTQRDAAAEEDSRAAGGQRDNDSDVRPTLPHAESRLASAIRVGFHHRQSRRRHHRSGSLEPLRTAYRPEEPPPLDNQTSLSTSCQVGPAPQVHTISVAATGVPVGPCVDAYDAILAEFASDKARPGEMATIVDFPVKHRIVTSGQPVFARPRRLAGDRLAAAKAEFKKLLDRGIIRPSSSQWASPLHLVPKPGNTWRITGDYRLLNARTQPDRHPLPIIEDLLQESVGKVFSVVDLYKAFYQIPVAEEDISKTAVTTPFGLFEFVGMPLGLRNSAQTFQRTMNYLLRDLDFVRCYQDDILVLSASHEQHLQHLRELLTILKRARLFVNWEKCQIGRSEVVFAGYLISERGFEPPAAKVEAIARFPKPSDSTQLRRFIGMLNFFTADACLALQSSCLPSRIFSEDCRRKRRSLHGALKQTRHSSASSRLWLQRYDQLSTIQASLLLCTPTPRIRLLGAALSQRHADDDWTPPLVSSRRSYHQLSRGTQRTIASCWPSSRRSNIFRGYSRVEASPS